MLIGRTSYRTGGSITTCVHRERGQVCGQRVVVLKSEGETAVVIGITEDEAHRLIEDDRPVKEGLRELEILVGRVA